MSNADDCTCFVTPEHMWTRHYGAIEPGSQMEPNPDCPVHFPPDRPSHQCACGGFIGWEDHGDHWEGSCYGKCGAYPRISKEDADHGREQHLSEREIETCCQGRNPNCGHHYRQ